MKISLIYLLFDLFCDNNNYSKDNYKDITEDRRTVAAWCCQNSLQINPDKMKSLLIRTRQMLQNTPADLDLHVTLLEKELCLVVSVKDLGVHMDATMSFDGHITRITSSCLSSLSQINRVKHLLDRNTLLNVINARVFSKLVHPPGLVRQRRISTNYRMSKTSQLGL